VINPNLFLNYLNDVGIDFFSGVPDSLLKYFCSAIDDQSSTKNHIIAANEGGALSIGIGYHLSTKKIPLIYLQNSGLGNLINPLLSLADENIYSIPALIVVGWRGHPDFSDEPQHIKQGKITEKLIKTMGYGYSILGSTTSDEEAVLIVDKALEFMLKNNSPYFLLAKPNTFYEFISRKRNFYPEGISRHTVLNELLQQSDESHFFVATTGFTSRELNETRISFEKYHGHDFLTIGGMGHCSQIALGIALSSPNKNIICIDGDGSLLMHMGSLAINASLGCKNFKHLLLNNSAHESVGGQATIAGKIDLVGLSRSLGYKFFDRLSDPSKLKNKLSEFLDSTGPAFLEVQISQGVQKNLSRPNSLPKKSKEIFTKKLNEK